MTVGDSERPDTELELSRLKDFQRLTVDRVFQRLYLDANPTRRFLVADEVGLGKTLVARGVVARAIDHLWDKVGRIDIVYLCSNSDIARQNVARLTLGGMTNVPESPRITLLPLSTHEMGSRRINVIPLTPGTSLKVAENLGLKLERALILHLLGDAWGLDHTGACRFFAGNAKLVHFKRDVRYFGQEHSVDEGLANGFRTFLDEVCKKQSALGERTIRNRLRALVNDYRLDRRRSDADRAEQRKIIGELRQLLGQSCIQSLEPDLIILDEFQRFKDLLGGDSPEAEMARQLFDYEDHLNNRARVLLLSATPYKMFTTPDEANGESHYDDFVRTARFLLNEEPHKADELAQLLKDYRSELFRVTQDGPDRLTSIREGLERILRSVMVRTERLAVTPDRSGMLAELPVRGLTIERRDVLSYAEGQRLAIAADQPDTMEYWKASPWLLNFMEDYKLAKNFDQLIDSDPKSRTLLELVGASPNALLDWKDVDGYRRLDPAHGRLRWLLKHVLDAELWRLLWLPPTLGYYRLAQPFESIAATSPTKTLIFSAWRVVPRVVAAVLSHEAERRLYSAAEGEDADLAGAQERLGDLLRIARREGTVGGLTTLSLLYPSGWMAEHCDPMRIGAELARATGDVPTLEAVLLEVERVMQPLLGRITAVAHERTAPDESWYWAAPILMDLTADGEATAHWLRTELVEHWGGGGKKKRGVQHLAEENDDEAGETAEPVEDHSAMSDLVARVRRLQEGERPTGAPPKDLARSIALMAVAGPATAALRTLARVGGLQLGDPAARSAAARIGSGFRTLFNQPDSTAAVRASTAPEDYWKQCLEYSAGLGMQAMLDEYAHLLMSEAGLHGKNSETIASRLADRISAVIGIRRARVGARDIHVARGKVQLHSKQMRSRFAMRFGEERASDTGDNLRADDVRHAFNSPFGPFVLATTSVGQEGLDFHFYCHSVVHWNLPPNPVDLEQREGRVHRFKGLAVRKNVAIAHGAAWYANGESDAWEATFGAAVTNREGGENDLVPFWVYPVAGGATIERHVPNYPLSRDVERFGALRDSLALYRMVFGQPRQEELLAYLARTVPADQIAELAGRLQISLAPA